MSILQDIMNDQSKFRLLSTDENGDLFEIKLYGGAHLTNLYSHLPFEYQNHMLFNVNGKEVMKAILKDSSKTMHKVIKELAKEYKVPDRLIKFVRARG